jgi:rhodanese-related sulfurtransferase
MNVTAWLRQQGFDNVQSLRGGIDRWSREIDPSVPLY